MKPATPAIKINANNIARALPRARKKKAEPPPKTINTKSRKPLLEKTESASCAQSKTGTEEETIAKA